MELDNGSTERKDWPDKVDVERCTGLFSKLNRLMYDPFSGFLFCQSVRLV